MARRGGFPGGGMPGNMSNLMKQAQRMQRQMEESAKELESAEFTAAAGGGAVEVTVTGKKEVTKVKLDPEAVDPDDVEMLEDLIMAATNEALRKAEEASAANMAKLTGGLGGAGALVPITGFANGVASAAIEYKKEGQVFGIGSKIFTIAGPVILYGVVTSWILGLIFWLFL